MSATKSIQYIKIIILGIILGAGVSYLYAWTGPTQSAPNGNVAAPIHTGTGDQVKSGGLGVTNLVTDGLTVTTGAGVGKVLTSDATGKATWQNSAGGGVGGRFWTSPWQACNESTQSEGLNVQTINFNLGAVVPTTVTLQAYHRPTGRISTHIPPVLVDTNTVKIFQSTTDWEGTPLVIYIAGSYANQRYSGYPVPSASFRCQDTDIRVTLTY